MPKTLDLLDKALKQKSASEWARTFNISPSAITNARARGRLSPSLAGNIAIKLGENQQHWIAIAALEAEPNSPLLTTLKDHQKQWLYSSKERRRLVRKKPQERRSGVFFNGLLTFKERRKHRRINAN